MKGRVVERLAREHILPELPDGFTVRRSLIYRRPLDYFLCGLSFGTSAFASYRVFVEAFVQPLYVRKSYLTYTFGFRVGQDFWDIDEAHPEPTFAEIAASARRDAVPFFEQLEGLDRFCEIVPILAAEDWPKVPPLTDPHVMEALGYAALLRGHKEEGLRFVEGAIASATEHRWEEQTERGERVRDAVTRLGLEAGQALLEQWRSETIRNLRIEE